MHWIITVPQCSSTNDEILKHLDGLKPSDTLSLYTFDQTQGRGQYGNVWKMAPRQNLAFSMAFLCKKISLPSHPFNFHTANVVRRFIAKKTEKAAQVKWPNDVILLGKKVSGMLIERKTIAQKEFFIVGIGINILQENFEHLPKSGSIFTQTAQTFDLVEWTEEMHSFIVKHLFEPLNEKQILEEFNQHLFRRGKISVFEIQGIRQNGIIQYTDTQGFLWINLENNSIRKFYHKEVELLY